MGGGLDLGLDVGATVGLGESYVVLTSDGLTGAFDHGAVSVEALADVGGHGVALAVLYEDDEADVGEDVDHVRVMVTYEGDANGDGAVGPSDLSALKLAWLTTGATWQAGDFNYDGQVGPADLTLQKLNWLEVVPGGAGGGVPEPTSLALLAMGVMAVRRRKS